MATRPVVSEEELELELDETARVVAVIAHDLNNILAVVRGFGEIVRDELGPENPLCDDVAQILSAVTQGSSLTTSLLAIGSRSDFDPQTFDVDEHLAALELQDVASSFGAGVPISFDPEQLSVVLRALVDNARQATTAGGAVHLATSVRDGRVTIAVRDGGVGMDEATRARCFEPFFSTRGRAHKGLGLAVARGIVRQGGGTIDLESSPGVGTTVRIGLPVA